MAVANFQGALRTYLIADPALAALIIDRMYSFPAPMNLTDAYIVFQTISEEDYGTLSSKVGVVIERWQFDIYAKTIDAAEAVKIALYDALHYLSYSTLSGYLVYFAKRESGSDAFDAASDGAEDGWHRKTQDYMIKRNINAA